MQAADPGGSGLREYWSFLEWGPTTDNVLAHLVPGGGRRVLTVEFWRPEHLQRRPGRAGRVFTPEISPDELAGILDYGIAALGGGPGSKRPAVTQGRSLLRAAGAVSVTQDFPAAARALARYFARYEELQGSRWAAGRIAAEAWATAAEEGVQGRQSSPSSTRSSRQGPETAGLHGRN